MLVKKVSLLLPPLLYDFLISVFNYLICSSIKLSQSRVACGVFVLKMVLTFYITCCLLDSRDLACSHVSLTWIQTTESTACLFNSQITWIMEV